jgi:hypothetical protein
MKISTGHNSTYKKLAVQWLNEALCFVSSSVVADSFRLRNRQLLVAAKRYGQLYETTTKRTGTTRRLTLQDQLTSQWTTFKPLHSDNFQTLKSNK